MKLKTKDFLKAVEAVSSLPGTKIPEANYVQFGNGLLRRTTHEAHCEVALPGSDEPIILDGEFLKRLKPPGEMLEIVTGEQHVLTCGEMTIRRNKVVTQALPPPEPKGEAVKIILPANAIPFVIEAASRDETRYTLCGVILDGQNGNLVIGGADGPRAHAMNAGETKLEGRLTIGSAHARLIPDGAVLSVHENCMVVESDGLKLILNMLEGKPPSMRQVLQDTFDEFAKLPKAPLKKALDRFQRLHPGLYVELEFTKDSLILSCADANGAFQEPVPCESRQARKLKIKPAWILDVLDFLPEPLILSTYEHGHGLVIHHNNLTIIMLCPRIQ